MENHFEVSSLSERSAVAADELAKWWASSSFSGSAALLLQQQLESARAQADYGSFLDALLSQGDALMKSTSSHEESLEDVVSAFGLIIVLLSATPSSSRASLVTRVVDVAASPISYSESRSSHVARLRILANLFNSLRSSSSSSSILNSKVIDEKSLQLEVLKRLVTYASETKQLEAGSPVTSYLVASIGPSWGLTPQQSADFFLHVSKCYGRMGETEEEQQWVLRHLISLESQSVSDDDLRRVAIQLARSAALSYLAAPAGQQKYEVPRLRSVALLSKIPEHSRLYDLVQVFASGGMASFNTWCSSSPNGGSKEAAESELSSLGLNYTHCFETMRLLSFCTLASSSKLLSFDSIQSALNCPANEVESWILKATSAGLVDCRIDQLSNQVVVTRCTARVFDKQAWTNLQTQLVNWIGILDNLKTLL